MYDPALQKLSIQHLCLPRGYVWFQLQLEDSRANGLVQLDSRRSAILRSTSRVLVYVLPLDYLSLMLFLIPAFHF